MNYMLIPAIGYFSYDVVLMILLITVVKLFEYICFLFVTFAWVCIAANYNLPFSGMKGH